MLYKENPGVPLLVRMPNAQGGGTSISSLVQMIDIAPTLLAMTGMPDDKRAERYPRLYGQNLLPLITGEQIEERDRAALFLFGNVAERPQQDHPGRRPFCQAIVTSRFKFGRHFSG